MNIEQVYTDSSLVIRMWKDETFREKMGAQSALSLAHPSGSSAVSFEASDARAYPTDWDTCTDGGTICGTRVVGCDG